MERGFQFNNRDPDLMGNKYEDFTDGKTDYLFIF